MGSLQHILINSASFPKSRIVHFRSSFWLTPASMNEYCTFHSTSLGVVVWTNCRTSEKPEIARRVTASASSPGRPCKNESGHTESNGSIMPSELRRPLQVTREFVGSHYLPLVLVGVVLAGLASPGPGRLAQQFGLSAWSTSGIFFVSGLNLRSGEMKRAAEAWPLALFALVSILFITPLAAIPILQLPLSPKEFSVGLAIFFCVPTTLSSAVSMTQLARANTALALALTVTSNILGVVTMPTILSKLFATGGGVSISAGPLMRSLMRTILIPLFLGKISRSIFGLGRWVDARKRQLSMLSSSFLALVPWMQVSCSKALLLQIHPLNFLAAAAVGTTVHLLYLLGNTAVVQLMAPFAGSTTDEVTAAQRAAVLVASQKTLPVAVAVIGKLGATLGDVGIIVLPCIALHVIQIIIDSMLVNYWVGKAKYPKTV